MARGDASYQKLSTADIAGSGVLVLFGSDSALIDSAGRDLAQRIAMERTIDQTTRVPAADILAEPNTLIDFFSDISLFGEKRLLWVDGLNERLAPICGELLARGAPPSDDVVLFTAHSLKSRSKLLDAFRQSPFALAISCYDVGIDRSGLRKRIADEQLSIDDDALDRLLEVAQALDPSAFRDVLAKLCLLAEPGGRVGLPLVEQATPPQAVSRDADLLTAALSNRRAALYHLFQNDLQDGGSAAGFLAALGRALASAMSKARGGRGGPRLHFRAEEAVTRAVSRTSDLAERIERVLAEIHRTETRLRSGSSHEREEVERLLIRAAQTFNAGLR